MRKIKISFPQNMDNGLNEDTCRLANWAHCLYSSDNSFLKLTDFIIDGVFSVLNEGLLIDPGVFVFRKPDISDISSVVKK